MNSQYSNIQNNTLTRTINPNNGDAFERMTIESQGKPEQVRIHIESEYPRNFNSKYWIFDFNGLKANELVIKGYQIKWKRLPRIAKGSCISWCNIE